MFSDLVYNNKFCNYYLGNLGVVNTLIIPLDGIEKNRLISNIKAILIS